jgi:hypothetical protein
VCRVPGLFSFLRRRYPQICRPTEKRREGMPRSDQDATDNLYIGERPTFPACDGLQLCISPLEQQSISFFANGVRVPGANLPGKSRHAVAGITHSCTSCCVLTDSNIKTFAGTEHSHVMVGDSCRVCSLGQQLLQALLVRLCTPSPDTDLNAHFLQDSKSSLCCHTPAQLPAHRHEPHHPLVHACTRG